MNKLKRIAIAGMFLLVATQAYADISTTTWDGVNANDLVDLIMGTGITYSGATYTGLAAASGSFTNGLDAGIGMASGLLMTSGLASNVGPSNTSDAITGANNQPGDADLNGLLTGPGGTTTYDAAILEFDFQFGDGTVGGDLFFNYVFGSDEYNEYTNSTVNDVFGLFVNGTNIALIPGTTTSVNINTVNGGNPFGTNASNPSLFNNNDLNDGGPFFDFEYDGFTDVFTATKLGLGTGLHHIKLAIADTGDSILDSGVFIQGSSFSDKPTPIVPVPGAFLLGSMGLGFASWRLKRRKMA
jgi:hypothetical protein